MVNTEKVARAHYEARAKELEERYNEAKMRECEELHNGIVDFLNERKATVQNALYVLEMVRYELLRARYEQLCGNVVIDESKLPLKKGIKETTPLPITAAPPEDEGSDDE